jgi:hypothetical protein
MHGKNKLAVAMTAISVAAVVGGIGAGAAHAQSEVLQATATTFRAGAGGYCFKGSASVTFSASGPATGPYAGTFTETPANVSVSAPTYTSRTLTLSIPFTITSGSTSITGTITNPPPYSGGTILCSGGSFHAGGPIVNAQAATYTATIQNQRRLAKAVSGTAQVSAAFEAWPYQVLGTPPTVTLLNFPSP